MINQRCKNEILWVVRILLTLAFLLVMGFIFSNSLKTAEQSSAQSSQVTQEVKDVIETINPDVSFGGANEEEDFNILHSYVRNFGHFAEFALLCALATWCVRSYTKKKPFFIIPVPLCVGVACFDEYLQSFSDGRAKQISDVLTDSLGAIAGFIFAICIILIVGVCISKRKKRQIALDGVEERE